MAGFLDDGFVGYDAERDVAEFRLFIDQKEHIARVSGECLSDHCGRKARTRSASHAAYLRESHRLQQRAMEKVAKGLAPEILTGDW